MSFTFPSPFMAMPFEMSLLILFDAFFYILFLKLSITHKLGTFINNQFPSSSEIL